MTTPLLSYRHIAQLVEASPIRVELRVYGLLQDAAPHIIAARRMLSSWAVIYEAQCAITPLIPVSRVSEVEARVRQRSGHGADVLWHVTSLPQPPPVTAETTHLAIIHQTTVELWKLNHGRFQTLLARYEERPNASYYQSTTQERTYAPP